MTPNPSDNNGSAQQHQQQQQTQAVACGGCCCGRRRRAIVVNDHHNHHHASPSTAAEGLQQSHSHPQHHQYDDDCTERSKRSTRSIYHDAVGEEVEERCEQDLFYFDAVEDTIYDDDEALSNRKYPIITKSYIPPHQHVSMLEPETLLRHDEQPPVASVAVPTEDNRIDEKQQQKSRPSSLTSILSFRRRKHDAVQASLKKPRVSIVERGYPGELNEEELNECQKFYQEVHDELNDDNKNDNNNKLSSSVHDIVYNPKLKNLEEEPYTLCRFMRATKFDSDAMLDRLKTMVDDWDDAAEHDFYPDIEQAIGAPTQIFLTQYPFFYFGNAKNGCPVSYLQAGEVDSEGVLCLTPIDRTHRFFWHQFSHVFPRMIAQAQENNPDFVRCESINVMNLAGLFSSQMTSEANEVIKNAATIGNYFPETLHCMLILNAPGWFAVAWRVIKSFIDPRTAKKIEVYSNESRGRARLLELVDSAQVPSDFGGSAMSFDDQIQQLCSNSRGTSERRVVEVVRIQKTYGNSCKKLTDLVELKEDEFVTINIHTRSVTGASVSVTKDDMPVLQEEVQVARTAETIESFSEDKPPTPYCTEICSRVRGPGNISIHLACLEDEVVIGKKLPQGYFLVDANVQCTL